MLSLLSLETDSSGLGKNSLVQRSPAQGSRKGKVCGSGFFLGINCLGTFKDSEVIDGKAGQRHYWAERSVPESSGTDIKK